MAIKEFCKDFCSARMKREGSDLRLAEGYQSTRFTVYRVGVILEKAFTYDYYLYSTQTSLTSSN